MKDFNSKEYIDFIQTHTKDFSNYSKGNEKNFKCPTCNDGKPNNFYFNTDKGAGYCQKCQSKFSALEYAKLLGYTSKKSEYKQNYLQWDYTDIQGNFLYGKRRFDFTGGNKAYIPIIKINNQFIEVKKKDANFAENSILFDSLEKVVFNYPRVKKAEVIFLVEGEKCSEKLQSVIDSNSKEKPHLKKYASTTIYDNSKTDWNHNYSEQLTGKIVVILPDNDEAGVTFSNKVFFNLKKYCRASIVNIPNLEKKQDVYDYFENGNTWESFEQIVNDAIPILGLNDIDRSKKFCLQFKEEIRHSDISGYYFWNGKSWEQSEKYIVELVKNFSINLHDDLMNEYRKDTENNKEFKHAAARVTSERAIKSILNLSKSDKNLVLKESSLDSNKNLLNLNNVTYDLRNHKPRRHTQDDNLTIILPYDYDSKAKCPVWDKFLKRIFNDDKELIGYIQELIGYTLTGETKLQSWYFLYGSGRNGKSVFSEIINRLVGSYGTKIRTESIMSKDYISGGDSPNPEIAKLRGKRFVLASEVSDSHKLNESLVKDLTGGDIISARFLNQNSFEFAPQCKLWMYGNHKPFVKGTDDGIWRRIKLIPFKVTIPENEVDAMLIDKLTKEISGILNWSLEGLKRLQKLEYKIIEPEIIKQETKAYRNEMDILGQFLSDNGYEYGAYKILCKELHDDYKEYCHENGYHALSTRRIGDYLKTNQVETKTGSQNKKSYYGVGKKD